LELDSLAEQDQIHSWSVGVILSKQGLDSMIATDRKYY